MVYPLFPFGVIATISLLYRLITGKFAGPTSLPWEAFCAGFLFWFLFPVLLLRRFTALGYWWTVGAFAFPFAASLALAVRTGLVGWLLFSFLLGVPLGLILRARRAYFARLRLIREGPR